MSGTQAVVREQFDPLAPASIQRARYMAEAEQRRQAALDDVRDAFAGAPAAVAWLRAALAQANDQPTYTPGNDFAHTAFNEGRRSVLREIVHAIDDALKA